MPKRLIATLLLLSLGPLPLVTHARTDPTGEQPPRHGASRHLQIQGRTARTRPFPRRMNSYSTPPQDG